MADEMKEKTQQVEGVVKALQALADQGFLNLLKFPISREQATDFLKQVAAEYISLRNANPEGGKLQALKDAIEAARGKTDNVLLNSPSAKIELVTEVPGIFGNRHIDKLLEKLA